MPQEVRDLHRVCRECSQPFTLSKFEVLSYVDRGFEIPRRCRKCREARRAVAAALAEAQKPLPEGR